MAHLRTLPGIESATPQQINPGGTSYILVAYHGDIAQLAAALGGARLDGRDQSGTVVRIRSGVRQAAGASAATSCTPRQPPPAPQPRSGRQPAAGPQPNEAGPGPDRASARLAAKRGRRPLHRLRRQPRSVRSFPQVEHVAGQGDDPHRAAPLGPDLARAQLRRAGRRAAVRRGRAARRGGAVPRLEPGAGHRPAAGHGRRRGAAGLGAATARPEDPARGHAGDSHRPSRRRAVRGADPAASSPTAGCTFRPTRCAS